MNKRITFLISAMILGLLLSSCSVLKSEYYIGEIETVTEEDLSDESIWMCNDEAYYVRRSGSNTFVAATLEWEKEKGDYMLNSFPVVLTELDDHLFLNIQEEDNLYTIFRASPVGCSDSTISLVLFSVDKKMMKQAIDDGKIKARVENDNIILEGTKEEQDEYIKNNIQSVFGMDPLLSARLIHDKKEKKKNQKKASPDKDGEAE